MIQQGWDDVRGSPALAAAFAWPSGLLLDALGSSVFANDLLRVETA